MFLHVLANVSTRFSTSEEGFCQKFLKSACVWAWRIVSGSRFQAASENARSPNLDLSLSELDGLL